MHKYTANLLKICLNPLRKKPSHCQFDEAGSKSHQNLQGGRMKNAPVPLYGDAETYKTIDNANSATWFQFHALYK